MTYHHTPGHPVADIYMDWAEEAGIIETLRGFGGTLPPRSQSAHATEHPAQAEEGWLGTTDFESDSPGGWAR